MTRIVGIFRKEYQHLTCCIVCRKCNVMFCNWIRASPGHHQPFYVCLMYNKLIFASLKAGFQVPLPSSQCREWIEHGNIVTYTLHYRDVMMSTIASQINGVLIVNSTVCSGADQREHQSSSSLAFVKEIHRWLAKSPHKGPVTRKMFPFYGVIIISLNIHRF